MSFTDEYYKQNAQEFFDSTVNADVESIYERFFKYVPVNARILDLGCGSGRDTKAFLNMGFDVDAIDGSEELCELASDYTGISIKCMDFMDLDVVDEYDAIWACASLLHVSENKLPIVLGKLVEALHTGGVLYSSFKYGEFEGERDGRFFLDMNEERIHDVLKIFNKLEIVEEWTSEDVRPDKICKWMNVITRKSK